MFVVDPVCQILIFHHLSKFSLRFVAVLVSFCLQLAVLIDFSLPLVEGLNVSMFAVLSSVSGLQATEKKLASGNPALNFGFLFLY